MGDFPELLEGDDGLYVRAGREQGFTPDECRAINAMRLRIRNGECIEPEAALDLACQVLAAFAPVSRSMGDGSGSVTDLYFPENYDDGEERLRKYLLTDMERAGMEALCERSKFDTTIIVGSEVRQLVMYVRRLDKALRNSLLPTSATARGSQAGAGDAERFEYLSNLLFEDGEWQEFLSAPLVGPDFRTAIDLAMAEDRERGERRAALAAAGKGENHG